MDTLQKGGWAESHEKLPLSHAKVVSFFYSQVGDERGKLPMYQWPFQEPAKYDLIWCNNVQYLHFRVLNFPLNVWDCLTLGEIYGGFRLS